MYISIWVFVFVFYILEKRDMGGLFLTEIIIEARRISRHSKKKGNMRSICYFFHETGGVCTQQEVLLNFKTITKKSLRDIEGQEKESEKQLTLYEIICTSGVFHFLLRI
jgi:hypothetical protein